MAELPYRSVLRSRFLLGWAWRPTSLLFGIDHQASGDSRICGIRIWEALLISAELVVPISPRPRKWRLQAWTERCAPKASFCSHACTNWFCDTAPPANGEHNAPHPRWASDSSCKAPGPPTARRAHTSHPESGKRQKAVTQVMPRLQQPWERFCHQAKYIHKVLKIMTERARSASHRGVLIGINLSIPHPLLSVKVTPGSLSLIVYQVNWNELKTSSNDQIPVRTTLFLSLQQRERRAAELQCGGEQCQGSWQGTTGGKGCCTWFRRICWHPALTMWKHWMVVMVKRNSNANGVILLLWSGIYDFCACVSFFKEFFCMLWVWAISSAPHIHPDVSLGAVLLSMGTAPGSALVLHP